MTRSCHILFLTAILCLFVIMSGCPDKKEPASPSRKTAPPVSEQPQSATSEAAVKGSQMDKALAVHKEFVTAFNETLAKGDTVEAVRERIALADRTRLESMMARSDMSDPDASEFLVRFTDLLQRYQDLGTEHIATLEEVNRLHALGKEKEGGLARLPEKERAQATKEFNAIVDRHNSLVQGQLAKELKELEDLSKELMDLK